MRVVAPPTESERVLAHAGQGRVPAQQSLPAETGSQSGAHGGLVVRVDVRLDTFEVERLEGPFDEEAHGPPRKTLSAIGGEHRPGQDADTGSCTRTSTVPAGRPRHCTR